MAEPAIVVARAASVTAAPTPVELLQLAVEQGADLDKLKALMDLQDRWEAGQAKKAFIAAMQEFHADPPVIVKNKQVKFKQTEYKHASHDQVTAVISAALAKVHITHRWEVEQEEGRITVNCILTHVDGYSASARMIAEPDTSGSKNSIQAIGSAVTYLQRYTLQSVTGIAAKDDDDGAGAEPIEKISESQLSTLTDMIESTGTDRKLFLAYLNLEALEDLPAIDFNVALTALKQKEKAK